MKIFDLFNLNPYRTLVNVTSCLALLNVIFAEKTPAKISAVYTYVLISINVDLQQCLSNCSGGPEPHEGSRSLGMPRHIRLLARSISYWQMISR